MPEKLVFSRVRAVLLDYFSDRAVLLDYFS
jgi:hypothetical protein